MQKECGGSFDKKTCDFLDQVLLQATFYCDFVCDVFNFAFDDELEVKVCMYYFNIWV